MLTGTLVDGLYQIDGVKLSKANLAAAVPLSVWHAWFSHLNKRKLIHTLKKFHLPVSKYDLESCNSCSTRKAHCLPCFSKSFSTSRPLELVYADIWGPSPVPSLNGVK